MATQTWSVLISCEHGGNQVPEPYRPLFAGQDALLATHRGWDIGILPLARRFASGLQAPLQAAEVTRLLVDLNRSLHNRTLWSEFTRELPAAEQQRLLQRHYHPFRQAAEQAVAARLAEGERLLHLAVHSFTPELRGKVRSAEIGLLYDTASEGERRFCRQWQMALQQRAPQLRIRRNYPYRGSSDSVGKALRQQFGTERYLGIELEVNQALPLGPEAAWERIQQDLLETFRQVLEQTGN